MYFITLTLTNVIKIILHFTTITTLPLIVHYRHFLLVALSVAGVMEGVGWPRGAGGVTTQGPPGDINSLVTHCNENDQNVHMTDIRYHR